MSLIYCVEDDQSIRELILYALKNSEYEAKGFERATEFYQAVAEKVPDLVLLDIMLPQENGLSILKTLRTTAATAKIGVILLTAKAAELDKVVGLDAGADDYITKPFSVLELLSRIKAALRRTHKETREMVFGGLCLNLATRTVLANGTLCVLTFKEFELLHYLMLNHGLVVSREKILEAVWACDFEMETRTVDMHIKSLRQKLGGCGLADCIKTIRSVGYSLQVS